MDWLRWHHGSVTDPKFQLVARKSGTSLPAVIAVWAFLLETASQNADRGDIGTLDCEAIDLLFGFDASVTLRDMSVTTVTSVIVTAMRDRGLLDGNRIANWDKRQPKREDLGAADRKRRQRERQQNQALSEPVTQHVTQCHAASRAVTTEEKRGEEKREEKELRRSHGSRLPSTWQPSEEQLAWARSERPDVDANIEADSFRDHWTAKPGKDGTKLDWDATWRNWIRRARGNGKPVPKSAPLQKLGFN
jgi:hypothetical protein